MSRARTKPEVSVKFGKRTESHPAFGQIGVSRVSGGAILYGSDFRHQHYMVITIRRSEVARDLAEDWFHGGQDIIEVALSEAQWATFVSSPNVGLGVPCTIQFEAGKGYIDGIALDNESYREKFALDINEDIAEAITLLTELEAAAPTKKLREKAFFARKKLVDSIPWVSKQFAEHTEKVVEKAKIEINAYGTQMLMQMGMKALAEGGTPILQLREGAETSTPDVLASGDEVPEGGA